MPRVFISHSKSDQDLIESAILPPLRAGRFEPWYSREDITITQDFQKEIRQALEECSFFMVVISRESVASEWVQGEVSRAIELGKKIIVVRVDDCPATDCDIRLARIQCVDLREDQERAVNQIVNFLRATEASSDKAAEKGGSDGVDVDGRLSSTEDVLAVFRRLTDPDADQRNEAAAALRRADWGRVAELTKTLVSQNDESAIDVILDGLAALESNARAVGLLKQLSQDLSRELQARCIRLLDRKRLGLQREKLARLFTQRDSAYEIDRVLGNGLFTASFRARHRHSGLDLVVRVLLPNHALHDPVRLGFLDLARRSMRYVHPRLAITRDVGVLADDDLYYCVRDYFPGRTLQDLLDDGQIFAVPAAMEVVRQVAEALTAVHARGEVHGAVKPTNIFLKDRHSVALGDPSLPPTMAPANTQRLLYDYRYLPPELLLGSTDSRPSADCYSLGCVAYQLLYGHPPFEAEKIPELVRLHLEGAERPVANSMHAVEERQWQVVAEMLSVEPSSRPQTAEALVELLQHVQEVEPGEPVSKVGPDPGDLALAYLPMTAERPPATIAPTVAPDRRPRDYSIVALPATHVAEPEDDSRPRSEILTTELPLRDPVYWEDLPDSFGGYEIHGVLGRGGMGAVYLAEQTSTGQRVALKLLARQGAELGSRFQREVQILGQLVHPNIAGIFDAGETPEGRPFFAMEYVPGDNFCAFCDKNRLTLSERIELFVKICDGIQYAHEAGVVHRDLKPSNILMSGAGGEAEPKIIDFGIAKLVDLEYEDGTITGQFIGTPRYSSPEQAAGRMDIDARADVYSLGVVLYELLAGIGPFETDGRSVPDLLKSVMADDPFPRPSERLAQYADAEVVAAARQTNIADLRKRLRRGLDYVLLKALEKDREHRYQTPGQFASELKRALEGDRRWDGVRQLSQATARFLRVHRQSMTTAAIVAVSAIAGVILGVRCLA